MCLFYNLRGHRTNYLNIFLFLKNGLILTNSADSDAMSLYAAFHLGLQCLPQYLYTGIQSEKGLIAHAADPGPEFIKLFPCSTQLSTKLILLINVKMPTIVGILTFISMINTTSERLKARYILICRYFSIYEQLEFMLSWVEHEKSFIASGPD